MKESNIYRWLNNKITPVYLKSQSNLKDLLCIERQKSIVIKNINSFIKGYPFLNMLLWGEKGCGKSSMIKAIAQAYRQYNLKVIEFISEDIFSIFDLYEIVRKDTIGKYIVYFDDISFDEDDNRFRKFKSVIEGTLEEAPDNLMFTITSNRRHIIKDKALDTGDLYSRDDMNEIGSLYARFGIVVGFYPLGRDEYLKIVKHYLKLYGIKISDEILNEAENFGIERGGRSGRIAKQFAIFQLVSLQSADISSLSQA
jgi:hypothetical protein